MKTNEKLENKENNSNLSNAEGRAGEFGEPETLGDSATQTARDAIATRAQNTSGEQDTSGASSTETRDASATLNKDEKNNKNEKKHEKNEKKHEKNEKKREKSVQNAQNGAQKRANWVIRLWKYYSPYEKIWLISICTVGILLGIFFPEDASQPSWLRVVEIIVIIGGCSCELLLSKQSRWAFVVSFILYDTTQTIVYFANGLYISALFELIFWIPILWVSFYQWTKQADAQNHSLTVVKKVNYVRDLAIFIGVLIVSVVTGLLFTTIGALAESMPDWWYLDALANTFSVCNGLFLVFRFREQWLPWIGVAIVEAIMWILSGQYIMLVLSLGYLMNSLYGLIKWQQYIKKHPAQNVAKAQNIQNNQTK